MGVSQHEQAVAPTLTQCSCHHSRRQIYLDTVFCTANVLLMHCLSFAVPVSARGAMAILAMAYPEMLKLLVYGHAANPTGA